jgi:hypothetical protein
MRKRVEQQNSNRKRAMRRATAVPSEGLRSVGPSDLSPLAAVDEHKHPECDKGRRVRELKQGKTKEDDSLVN